MTLLEAYFDDSGTHDDAVVVAGYLASAASDEYGEEPSFRIGSFRFGKKKQLLPLQAADILAYECYKRGAEWAH